MIVIFQIRNILTSEGSVSRVALILFPETAMWLDSKPLSGPIPYALWSKPRSDEIVYLNMWDLGGCNQVKITLMKLVFHWNVMDVLKYELSQWNFITESFLQDVVWAMYAVSNHTHHTENIGD
jgi:hypothetical protein